MWPLALSTLAEAWRSAGQSRANRVTTPYLPSECSTIPRGRNCGQPKRSGKRCRTLRAVSSGGRRARRLSFAERARKNAELLSLGVELLLQLRQHRIVFEQVLLLSSPGSGAGLHSLLKVGRLGGLCALGPSIFFQLFVTPEQLGVARPQTLFLVVVLALCRSWYSVGAGTV